MIKSPMHATNACRITSVVVSSVESESSSQHAGSKVSTGKLGTVLQIASIQPCITDIFAPNTDVRKNSQLQIQTHFCRYGATFAKTDNSATS